MATNVKLSAMCSGIKNNPKKTLIATYLNSTPGNSLSSIMCCNYDITPVPNNPTIDILNDLFGFHDL
jgi:hypothetical protein